MFLKEKATFTPTPVIVCSPVMLCIVLCTWFLMITAARRLSYYVHIVNSTFLLVLGEVVVQYPQFHNLRACCIVADNVILVQQLIIIKNIRIIKVLRLTSKAITLPSDIPL